MVGKRLVSGVVLSLVWILLLIQPTQQFIHSHYVANARFSNVKKLYYSSELKEYLGNPEFNSTLPGEDAILQAYDRWRVQYNKGEYSPERFDNFKVNYMTLLTANAASERRSRQGVSPDFPSYMSLNEYGDCSIEEYKNIMASVGQSGNDEPVNPAMSSVPQNQQISEAYGATADPLEWDIKNGESSIEKEIREEQAKAHEVRQLYEDWCQEKGKPFDESRLPIFAEHYQRAVEYCAQTNKPLKLNEYADLTTEEYNSLSFNRAQQKESTVSSDGREQRAPKAPFNRQQQQLEAEQTAPFNGQKQQGRSASPFNGHPQQVEPTAAFNGQQQQERSPSPFDGQQQQVGPTASSTDAFGGQQQQTDTETASFKEKEEAQSKDSFNRQQQVPSSPKVPSQAFLNAGSSTGSYLDSISKGKVVATYFGEKPELKEEDLASLFSRLNDAKLEEEEAKIQARRAEVAALQAGEVARIKEEERARLDAAEDARQRALEKSRLKAWKEARQEAEIEAKQRAEGSSQEASETPSSPPAVPFRPMSGSYMGAVAKTWKSRSEYLAQLEASTKYFESLQDVPASELPKMYDQLDALTGSLPVGPKDADTGEVMRSLETVENTWEDEKSDEEVQRSVPGLSEIKDATITERTETKDTTQASTRRQRDELAARRAREEAKQWMRIQKQLEEQADLARERREREEKALLEAQKRAKELEAANLKRERRLKEFQAKEGKTDADGAKRIKELQESTEKALQEAARLREELQKLNKSKSPSIMSFFGGSKGDEKGKDNVGASKHNQRFAAAQRKREEVLNRMKAQERKKSFFDWLQNGPEEKKPTTLALVTMWSSNEDGSITGIVEGSSSFDTGVRITTSPILGKAYEGAVVVTASGNRYQLGEKETLSVGGANAADLFMGFFDGLQKSQETALLLDWKVNQDGTLTGIVSNKKGFNDGAKITTSPVVDEIGPGKVVRTLGGSYYRLL